MDGAPDGTSKDAPARRLYGTPIIGNLDAALVPSPILYSHTSAQTVTVTTHTIRLTGAPARAKSV